MFYYMLGGNSVTHNVTINSIISVFKESKVPILLLTPTTVFKDNDTIVGITKHLTTLNLKKYKINYICISCESFTQHKNHFGQVMNIIKNCNVGCKFLLYEYQANNIIFARSKLSVRFSEVKIYYVPLSYNPYFKELGKLLSDTKEKTIDVLFYGVLTPRRQSLITLLTNNKLKVVSVIRQNYDQLNILINKSKIVLDIFSYEENKVFDYYRLSYLLTNGVFVIIEKPVMVNITLEPQLEKYDKYIVSSGYNDIVKTVLMWSEKSQKDRNDMAEIGQKWFCENFNYKDDFFRPIKTLI